ncbi:putative leucine-rich repeat domain, L domain-containing protein [Rosa chinensis]|uniref:Putative leucine-rich repeat domain, L domain-containing protein n=1 Tax=Rosa chinensis TaxID=74649 RepID=A0A2P6Q638_ROSCH|nr:putative leucine-rich repeat domain, L domain-containing protein [Rosa chinensis]
MQVVFPNLVTLKVHGCNNSRFLFSFSVAKSFILLKHLKISICELLQEIVSSTRECNEENMDDMFPKLNTLKLKALPNLARFGTGNYVEFPVLKELEIDDCVKLVEFIGNKVATSSEDTRNSKEIEQRILEEEENLDVKSETVVQYILFDKKVGFPSLERLSIQGARELKAIWHVQLARDSFRRLKQVDVQECKNLVSLFPPSVIGRLNALETLKIWGCGSLEVIFELPGRSNVKEIHADTSFPHDQLKHFDCQNLDSINIYGCHSLKQIFPASVARGLQYLTRLDVDKCDAIEEIVGEEEEKEGLETIPPRFVFSKLTSVELKNLPQLTSFYPKTHASQWPLLEKLEVVRCDKVGILAAEFSFSQKNREMNHLMSQPPFFSMNEGSFVNLEDLELTCSEIWNGPPPANPLVFDKLKSITFHGSCAPFSKQASVIFLQRLQNLEKIGMDNCSLEAIFVNQGISIGEKKHDDAVRGGGLPRVRILSLQRMDELMHLGNDNSQSLLFPNLETIEVSWCMRLKSLESYAIFFRNLTTLTIYACDGLKYLTSYSMAKSLVQLTTLEVNYCDGIVVIVSSNGDDDACTARNEIAFSHLQHLKLTRLPSLQDFCSGNCTLKFPSFMTLQVEHCPIKLKISPEGVLMTEIDHQFQQNRVDYDSDDEEEGDVETAEKNPEILSEGPAS